MTDDGGRRTSRSERADDVGKFAGYGSPASRREMERTGPRFVRFYVREQASRQPNEHLGHKGTIETALRRMMQKGDFSFYANG